MGPGIKFKGKGYLSFKTHLYLQSICFICTFSAQFKLTEENKDYQIYSVPFPQNSNLNPQPSHRQRKEMKTMSDANQLLAIIERTKINHTPNSCMGTQYMANINRVNPSLPLGSPHKVHVPFFLKRNIFSFPTADLVPQYKSVPHTGTT